MIAVRKALLRAACAALGSCLWLAAPAQAERVKELASIQGVRANQLIGVATALALFTLALSGFLMWRRRRPHDALGARPRPRDPARLKGVAAIILLLAALLPLLAASLILLWLVERLILPRLPRAARWLGVAARGPARL